MNHNKTCRTLFASASLMFFVLFLFPTAVSANVWTKQLGSNSTRWWQITSSADGTKLAAVVDGGYIYTSSDGGVVWDERQGAGELGWMDIVSSSDGARLVAMADSDVIYYSTDSGVTWHSSNSEALEWSAVSSSADGMKLVAASGPYEGNTGVIYYSIDGGVNWTLSDAPTMRWKDVASDANGLNIVAVAYGGAIYTSANGGENWTVSNSGNRNWRAVAMSASNGIVVAGVSGSEAIYKSTNYGVDWSPAASGNKDWISLAVSADGTKMIASVFGAEGVYTSTDSGDAWNIVAETGVGDWRGVTSSSDGTRLAVLNYVSATPGSGYIWTFGPPAIVVTSPALSIIGTSQTATTAQLTANITSDGNASSTVRGFDYGTTVSYGLSTSTTGTYGNGPYSQDISGLTCGTQYYYRAFSTNSEGTGTSTGSTFTTSTCPVETPPVVSTPAPTTSSGGSGCSVLCRYNNLISMGNIQGAEDLKKQWPNLIPDGSILNTASAILPTFARDLSIGMNGDDVMFLQKYLNSHGFIIATQGVGSAGHETRTFGSLTKAALVKFQKTNKIFPAVGNFGPKTRAFVSGNN